MKKYLYIFLGLSTFILLTFFIAITFEIPILTDPTYILKHGGITAAFISIALLISDIILPVPSSIVMIANGAVFGFWNGVLITMIGGVTASLTGFYIGKKSTSYINKYITPAEQEQAKQLMNKWGISILIISRSIPILAETMSIMAGATGVSSLQMFLASIVGLLPVAILYSYTGVYAADLNSALWSFIIVMACAGLFWVIGKYTFNKK